MKMTPKGMSNEDNTRQDNTIEYKIKRSWRKEKYWEQKTKYTYKTPEMEPTTYQKAFSKENILKPLILFFKFRAKIVQFQKQ
jgi:hypothetical protein